MLLNKKTVEWLQMARKKALKVKGRVKGMQLQTLWCKRWRYSLLTCTHSHQCIYCLPIVILHAISKFRSEERPSFLCMMVGEKD